jgi:hypothetical protein
LLIIFNLNKVSLSYLFDNIVDGNRLKDVTVVNVVVLQASHHAIIRWTFKVSACNIFGKSNFFQSRLWLISEYT